MGFSDVVVIEAGLLMETVTNELPTAVSGPTTTVNDVGDVIVPCYNCLDSEFFQLLPAILRGDDFWVFFSLQVD